MNTVQAWKDCAYRETLAAAPAHPAGSIDLTEELPGERGGVQAMSGTIAIKTMSAPFWTCCK
ncbi:mersacidin/lichenicidin family type 2 lantibiotic [Streptomyces mobaraensis NBRC 13819 = DSM 40847]|uniref:Mersacidin/lichenicidin family type 2 lantibiotic n=2 Tax=Streptomyces mobaraensis TaxID=35621 RepID=A0A5N5W089_STRMB|nr:MULTISPECIES: mersacidin/lichenicidin family type 2 lantibiotic [Streptomyces]EME97393.1 hypothetical protein H340_26801 [Streptomyces mobaraensis NBRC 13819 = DSM 40847]KAB7834815.1 mersacidin/lichenicidin family type 2 lantibiotic [Streptomyces mobaraensis]MBC2877977.1 mersacidin/lichenicidin family type 2 lantibiotic [Streptomyces sp. TYQ1024]QTT72842.1 mersacidin/lichenicidin family type 2 lantibiotic [Streptomyces mobaraensis NBRC 13819 = DSM 40847]UBI39937.1 mersacidin/lichenicidin fa